jgi:putative transposase
MYSGISDAMSENGENPVPITRPVDEFHDRRRPADGVLIRTDQPTIVFDTVCTRNRQRWLANAAVHNILREVWTNSTSWLVGRYVIMPDHIHYFAVPSADPVEFKNWVQYWKSQFTRKYRAEFGESVEEHAWLPNEWDTRLRTWQAYDAKWEYVRNNSVRHQLVERPEDWPFQGEVHQLIWE